MNKAEQTGYTVAINLSIQLFFQHYHIYCHGSQFNTHLRLRVVH